MKRMIFLAPAPALALSGCVAVGGAVTPLGGGGFATGVPAGGGTLSAAPQPGTTFGQFNAASFTPGGNTDPSIGPQTVGLSGQVPTGAIAAAIGVSASDLSRVGSAEGAGAAPGCYSVTTNTGGLWPNVCI